MSGIGWTHSFLALLAIASGAVVLFRRKGTLSHRWIGYVYVVAMVGLNVTALMIYRLTGFFGPFHAAAIVSLATVVSGVVVAVRRRHDWIRKHYSWMTFSYLGLMAATASEVLTRVPEAPFWGAVLAGTLAVVFIGVRMIRKYERASIAPFERVAGLRRVPLLTWKAAQRI